MKTLQLALTALITTALSLAAAAQPQTLLHTTIDRLDATEAIVSRASMAAGTALPAHWHPGEEFTYIIAGSITLLREGQPPENFAAGSVVALPAGQVHSAEAGPEGVEIVTFRVHPAGEPVRMMAQGSGD